MSTPLARLLERQGKRIEDIPRGSRLGKIFTRHGVRASNELTRIKELPRRDAPIAIDELVDLMTQAYKTPEGSMRLRPVQAQVLADLHDYRGVFASVTVGGGKSLISLLAPTVIGASRPVLLVPAKLRDKTRRERDNYAKHWRLQPIEIVSYELLSRVSGASKLEELAPDLIIADEAHRCKNLQAALTRRIRRYVDTHSPVFAAMTGTITTKSLRDYGHLIAWALRDLSPLPRDWSTLNEWCAALDEKTDFPLAPGALLELCNAEELALEDEKEAARRAFRRRLVQTPGVVATVEAECDASLTIELVSFAPSPAIREAASLLARKWELPDGQMLADAPQVYAHARQIALGFYYRWRVAPPDGWLDARRNWVRFVRNTLAHNRRGLDSELQVANACARGEYQSPEYLEWQAIRPTFTPETEAVWLCDSVLRYCAEWLEQDGICWVEHVAFGQELSRRTGCPYYGEGGTDANGTPIEQASGPIIASVASNGEGRNLQAWSRSLVTSCPASGAIWEQLLGRTHRSGQTSDEVTYEVLMLCEQHGDAWNKAIATSRYIETTTAQKQRLLFADVIEGK